MNYDQAIQFLYNLRLFGTKLGLENTFKLAAMAGNPQDSLRFIHVAGTNGKGSTCAMLESIYRKGGWRVGLFTSPHLVAFSERIQVNRRLIPEEAVARLVEEMLPLLHSFPAEAHPTFFEVVTVMALRYFTEEKCDLVIWETGMGGRLDATNIVTPLASVITNIQLDHEKWLGESIERIAAEKAGIIKPGVPVITSVEDREAMKVVFDAAQRQASPFTLITWTQAGRPPLEHRALPLEGRHQRLNAALAVATARALRPRLPVSEETIEAGLFSVQWPGRMQALSLPGQTIILDGAHNPSGITALLTALEEDHPGHKPCFILGVLGDKDWGRMCGALALQASRIVICPVQSLRTASPETLAEACRRARPELDVRICHSLAEALEQSRDMPFVVITGSLHFVGEAMEALHLSTGLKHGERSLNEWSAVPLP